MPIQTLKQTTYKPPHEVVVSWDTWRKGLNLLLRENEINAAEMVSASNLLLTGSGVPTKRWGSQNYFLSSPTGATNFVGYIKDVNENIQILSLSDWGMMTKKSGASYTKLTGASWPSGSRVEGAQLGGKEYLVSTARPWVRYDFSTLTNFATLAMPTGLTVTNVSSATGATEWSWRVTAISKSGGETLASTPISLASLPQDLTQTYIKLNWTAVSAASGDLVGYNIYRGALGDERWIGGVDDAVLRFDDVGTPTPDPFRTVPVSDTTGGPKAKYILRYQDRLVLAGIPGEPTKILISARYPQQERFDWYAGAGYLSLEPDSGQHITGLGIHQEKLVVFKENSVWQVTLNQIAFGEYMVLDPQYKQLTASQGCSSHRSIVPVENDLMFSNRKGIYILRYEPQLLTVLNANEISAKIKPFFESQSDADLITAAGAYIDKKYVLSFAGSKQTIVFDRERMAFTGPWYTPFGISQWVRYVDSNGQERWLAADADDNYVSEFGRSFPDDKGAAIQTTFKSRKEDFNDWTLFKTINEAYINVRGVQGTVAVNLYLEERSGRVTTAKSFTMVGTGTQGTSGIGTDQFGLTGLGLSNNIVSLTIIEQPKKSFIYKSARTFQIEIRTTGKTDNYELLGAKVIAIPQSRGNSPSSWNI